MKEIVWNDMLSVQVEEIDEDHRRLVGLFNILSRSVAQGDAVDYIAAVMEELVSCTIWHFRHEERLMLRYGYEGLAQHKAEHQELIESARVLQQRIAQEARPLASADIEYLEHWLTEHILTEDMKLGTFLCMEM